MLSSIICWFAETPLREHYVTASPGLDFIRSRAQQMLHSEGTWIDRCLTQSGAATATELLALRGKALNNNTRESVFEQWIRSSSLPALQDQIASLMSDCQRISTSSWYLSVTTGICKIIFFVYGCRVIRLIKFHALWIGIRDSSLPGVQRIKPSMKRCTFISRLSMLRWRLRSLR